MSLVFRDVCPVLVVYGWRLKQAVALLASLHSLAVASEGPDQISNLPPELLSAFGSLVSIPVTLEQHRYSKCPF